MPRVRVNEVDLLVEETGAGDPLVLVHGGWSDHATWRAAVPGLAESFTVVTYDRRGHSQSERPTPHGSRRDQEDDLAALIDALGHAPANVAASSYGSSIALGLATRRPELIRTLVVHEPALLSVIADDPRLTALVAGVHAMFESVLGQIEAGEVEGGTQRFFEQVVLGPGGWLTLPEAFRTTVVGNAAAFVAEQRDPGWADIDVPAVSDLPVPVLLTHGDQSPRWFREIVAALGRLIRDAETRTYTGAGHTPHLTHPDDLVAVVADFIRRRSRRVVATTVPEETR